MCGILGILDHRNNVTPDDTLLKQSGYLLDHRGPDNCGVFASEGIGLVHTRLSLIDLNPRSHQPFWDKSGRYTLVYNGEIYNFKELRSELESQGIQFRTTSDTEVLLEWLLAHPKGKALERLEGMFAFALYDKLEESLFLGRDRFGIKPLFIFDGDDRFIFASEIKAMRPWIAFEPDLLSISSFLFGFGGPTKGHSFFRDIKILAPGSTVEVRKD